MTENGTIWRRAILRAELARRGITDDQLLAKLAQIGVKEEPKNVRNKAPRGEERPKP